MLGIATRPLRGDGPLTLAVMFDAPHAALTQEALGLLCRAAVERAPIAATPRTAELLLGSALRNAYGRTAAAA
jgi:hypothetical protein